MSIRGKKSSIEFLLPTDECKQKENRTNVAPKGEGRPTATWGRYRLMRDCSLGMRFHEKL